jgi:hypothetical protein
MPYPAPFHRLVIGGKLYTDDFNTTLSLIPTGGASLPAVSDDLLDAVATVVGSWFDDSIGGTPPGIGIITSCTLTYIKLNRIGTDGRYVDAETKEHVYDTPIAGSRNAFIAPQLTVALTLRGTNERARAGRGRMFMPPSSVITSIGSDGRMDAATVLDHAKGGLQLLSAIDDAYLAEGVSAVAGIASASGSGAFQGVAQVSAGRVVDTMRSRRNKLDEDPQYWGAP